MEAFLETVSRKRIPRLGAGRAISSINDSRSPTADDQNRRIDYRNHGSGRRDLLLWIRKTVGHEDGRDYGAGTDPPQHHIGLADARVPEIRIRARTLRRYGIQLALRGKERSLFF